MILVILEAALALFLLWIIANVIRTMFHSFKAGGFWCIYNTLISSDEEKGSSKGDGSKQ